MTWKRTVRGVVLSMAAALVVAPAAADEAAPKAAQGDEAAAAEALSEQSVSKKGKVVIEGREIAYTATVGDLILRDDEGKPKARFTTIAYTRDGVEEPYRRPVMFSFNGGPGSASVWVHLGAYGPKKALLDDEGMPVGPPPGRLVDNPFSVLDVVDLVFIDPVSTGWSRPAPGEDGKQFYGFTGDVESVGELIRLWVTRNDRWASPKLIAGESYGTTRSAGLAGYLQQEHGMFINGIVLLSSVLNWETKVFNVGNDLPHVLILPTYTAAAWYHGKLGDRYPTLRAALDDAEAFAEGEYAAALMKGDDLVGEERERIRRRLAELTGLSESYLEEADLRVEIFRFTKELLRDRGLTVGRLDARYVGSDRDAAGETFEFDPASAVTTGYFVSLLKDYLTRQLGYRTDQPYVHASDKVRPWNYHERDRTRGYGTNAYANYAETLREAIHRNPYLRVLVLSGYYDLATPYFASDYTVRHMQLAPALRHNVRVAYYEAGHMMYVRRADHDKMRRDFLAFLDEVLAAGTGS